MKRRRNLTVKQRITLWYTVFFTALVVLAAAQLILLTAYRVTSEARSRLQDAVERSFYEIEYDDGTLYIDDDIHYMAQGVTVAVYGSDGAFVFGRIPVGFSGAPLLIKDEMRTVTGDDGARWHVYDTCKTIEGYGTLWVRGVSSPQDADAGLHAVLVVALLTLPGLVLVAVVGGYLITRRTLRPLDAMTATAQRISTGADLGARLHLDAGDDEVHTLAHTFDGMMDRLQTAFDNEKQFTSDVSHELRTPVSAILMQCEAADRADASREEMQAALHAVQRQAGKMSVLIRQLLLLARADNGTQAVHKEEIDLTQLCEMVCLEQESAAAAKGIAIETQLAENVVLRADETLLMRLLINLVSNAIAYGRRGGHVWVTLTQNETHITCAVRDDGIGIAQEHLAKIWNRFYQVDAARSHERTGAGLGLPMVRWIAQAHGGEVTVESLPGVGSTFTATLPKRPPTPVS